MDRGRVGEDRGSKETDGCPLTESRLSSTLHVGRVIVFLYMGSHRLLHNLADMCRKVSACIDLHMAMVPESYQHMIIRGRVGIIKMHQ
jgi:hypothetical protein